MEKKTVIRTLLMATLGTMFCVSCDNKKTEPIAETPVKVATGSNLKIGFVELDSLMSQYKFCKDYTLLLTKRGENIASTLEGKEKAFQQAVANFQRKLQEGAFTSQEEAENAQAGLRKQEMEYMQLRERLTMQLNKEQQAYTNEMRDSIQSFLNEYNKTKGFDYIISKAGDNILLAKKTHDITNDVVAGLNKRYKPSKQVSESQSGKTKK